MPLEIAIAHRQTILAGKAMTPEYRMGSILLRVPPVEDEFFLEAFSIADQFGPTLQKSFPPSDFPVRDNAPPLPAPWKPRIHNVGNRDRLRIGTA